MNDLFLNWHLLVFFQEHHLYRSLKNGPQSGEQQVHRQITDGGSVLTLIFAPLLLTEPSAPCCADWHAAVFVLWRCCEQER